MPIRAKRTVQTMGNRIPGGAKGGFASVEAYISVLFRVSQPDSAPTASVSEIQNTYGFQFFLSIHDHPLNCMQRKQRLLVEIVCWVTLSQNGAILLYILRV